MRNFQEVLAQRKSNFWASMVDGKVYQLVKEIQLLHPNEFDNIFLGLGGFHTEKVILACCGKFLEALGTKDIFINSKGTEGYKERNIVYAEKLREIRQSI